LGIKKNDDYSDLYFCLFGISYSTDEDALDFLKKWEKKSV